MSTVYPITTKYLKKGGSSGDIDQLVEDVNELKQDVAGIEEVDETQNTDITQLKSDVQTLQTSDLTQNDIIDKLRHQIILASGFYKNDVVCMMEPYSNFNTVYSFEKKCDSTNFDNFRVMTAAEIYTNNSKITLRFYRRNIYLTKYSYYVYSEQSNKTYGFVILNGLGEQVLNNKIVMENDLTVGVKTYLEDLINLYGTDYYKAHVNDTFYYDLLETNCTRVSDLTIPFTNGYTSSNFDAMTNLNNWVNSKVSAYDPTNSIKTDLTSTWTSSDYETMTNLKNWVESKAGGTTPTTTLKCPVDMYISTDGITDPQYSSHQVPFRISSASYKIGGSSCETSGYYISFHAELEGLNHITSMTILAIKQGQTFPTFSWDSLCKFYRADFSTSDANKYGGIYFIMSDGSVCFTSQIGRAAFLLNEPKYVHFLTETIILDQLKNNVCKISNEEIEASTSTYDTTRKPYYTFKGKEGSYRDYSVIEPKQN